MEPSVCDRMRQANYYLFMKCRELPMLSLPHFDLNHKPLSKTEVCAKYIMVNQQLVAQCYRWRPRSETSSGAPLDDKSNPDQ